MSRVYTTRTDGDDSYICYSKDNRYFEIPSVTDEGEVQDKLDSVLVSAVLSNYKLQQCHDDVYVNKDVVRQDYTLETEEGALILEELKQEFPSYVNYERSKFNFVGKYDGYREPYQNSSISFYDFGVFPSESLLLNFNTSYLASNLKHWYGLKFDLVSKEVLLKAVIIDYDGSKPALPKEDRAWSVTLFGVGVLFSTKTHWSMVQSRLTQDTTQSSTWGFFGTPYIKHRVRT